MRYSGGVLLKFLSISALLHLALLFIFLFLKGKALPPPPAPTMVEITTAPRSAARMSEPSGKAPTAKAETGRVSRAGRLAGARKKAGGNDTPRLGLNDLGIQWNKGPGVAIPSGSEKGSPEGEGEGWGSGGFGGGEILKQLRSTVSFREIHERIDTALNYPEELRDAGIEGTVKARLVISSDGVFNRRRSQIQSSSNYLRVHVVQTLRQALAEPLPSTYFRDGRELKVRLVFQFAMRRRENAMDANDNHLSGNPARGGAIGNYLSFYRAAAVIGSWKLGPITGYGIMPSIGVDPEWIVDRVGRVASNKVEGDPLQKYREDPEWGN